MENGCADASCKSPASGPIRRAPLRVSTNGWAKDRWRRNSRPQGLKLPLSRPAPKAPLAAPLRNFRHMLQNARSCALDGDEVVLDQSEGKESGKRGSRNIAVMLARPKKPLGSQGYES